MRGGRLNCSVLTGQQHPSMLSAICLQLRKQHSVTSRAAPRAGGGNHGTAAGQPAHGDPLGTGSRQFWQTEPAIRSARPY
ncbi:hypothetical protein SAMN04487905_10264 [Actinopolyspora xinjiangensis]|uniref:Uncharacterized protein n=1 Tax=Actinopolyspora xinjiangensis TaxID=405564 RepID=A0A1H0Q5Q7_9ACTN|nr:hypothetical protein SAMN04487905_10264 [Actinopolyspora xinjiangensis]